MSNVEKTLGVQGIILGIILPSYVGIIIIPLFQDPYKKQPSISIDFVSGQAKEAVPTPAAWTEVNTTADQRCVTWPQMEIRTHDGSVGRDDCIFTYTWM